MRLDRAAKGLFLMEFVTGFVLASLFGFLWFALKVVFWFFMFAMAKAIVPRYRYDQLMRLGWKVFLPTAMAAVAVVAAWRVFGHAA
jgi:NADH-quinone oxidoreductase subunit H